MCLNNVVLGNLTITINLSYTNTAFEQFLFWKSPFDSILRVFLKLLRVQRIKCYRTMKKIKFSTLFPFWYCTSLFNHTFFILFINVFIRFKITNRIKIMWVEKLCNINWMMSYLLEMTLTYRSQCFDNYKHRAL